MSLIKTAIKRVFHRLGYQIVAAPKWPTRKNVIEQGGYRLVNWKGSSGKYDVTAYRLEQERGNRAKIEQVWTNERNLQFLAQWLKDRGMTPAFVVCHGTRSGFEQKIFSAFFSCRYGNLLDRLAISNDRASGFS